MTDRDPRMDPKPGDTFDLNPEMRKTLKNEGKPIHRKRTVHEVGPGWVRFYVLPSVMGAGWIQMSLIRWRREMEKSTLIGHTSLK